MELNSETCKVTRFQWNAQFSQSDSPLFTVRNKKWYFKLKWSYEQYHLDWDSQQYYSDSDWNSQLCHSDSGWNLYLIKKERREMPAKFVVTAYVKSEDYPRTYLSSKEITQCDTCICNISRNVSPFNFSRSNLDGQTVTFYFTFDFFIQSKGEHKSVQTLSTPNLSDHPCLDRLSLDLRKLVNESSSSDLELKCGSRTFPAHRLILCARSEVFRAMLQSDMLENREGSVEIADMEPNAFEVFLRYVYTGTLPRLTVDTASPLYEAGDKYRLEALMKRCSDFLAINLTPESACVVLVLADAHNDKTLKEVALSYILDKKIPNKDEYWLDFCAKHPKLGIEVLHRGYKLSN